VTDLTAETTCAEASCGQGADARAGPAVVRAAYRARGCGRERSFGVGGSAYRPTALRDRLIVATTEQLTLEIQPGMGIAGWVRCDDRRAYEALI